MKLVVDIGNTLVKFAVFKQNEIVALEYLKTIGATDLEEIIKSYPELTSGIVSTVRDESLNFFHDFSQQVRFIEFDFQTKLPVKNLYMSPKTLGKDRIASTVGAWELFKNTNILIIDVGTSITYDLLTAKGEYLGGGISPGIEMRFKALHTFTDKLPLVQPEWDNATPLIGNTTESSILSGVQHAVLCEVDGMIDQYKQQFSELKIIVTGGDHKYFDKYLKNNIFAAPNLVLTGLKKILDFNEDF